MGVCHRAEGRIELSQLGSRFVLSAPEIAFSAYRLGPKGPMPEIPKILLSVKDVEAATGLSHSTVYVLINSGQLPSAKIGKRRVVTQAQLDRFVASLEDQTLDGVK